MKAFKAYKLVVVALTLVTSIFAITQVISVVMGQKQWDFRTYYYAATASQQGGNPYQLGSLQKIPGAENITLPFVYPPHSIGIFGLFAKLEYRSAFFLFLAVKLLACIALVWIWSRVVPCARADLWALVVTAFAGYRYTMLLDIRAGNVSVFEQVLLWGGILLLLKHKTVFGGMSILLASFFKLLPVALGPLIFVMYRSWRSFFVWLALTAGCVASYVMLYRREPKLWADFIATATQMLDERGRICPSSLAFLRDLGDITTLGDTSVYVAYLCWCGLIICAWAWAFWMTRDSHDVYPMLYLTIFAYVLIAPRVKDYSLIIALLPTLHIISATFNRTRWVIFACAIFWIPLLDYQPLGLAIWMYGVLLWWIWKYQYSPTQKMEITLNPLRVFRLESESRA